MALVKNTNSETTVENVEFHRVKITAAKETLRLLRTRLRLLEASSSQQQHELLPNLTKLELALSLAVHELQKAVTKRQIIEMTIEKSMLSTLLYIPPKKFFGSNDLNDIEQTVATQLQLMLTQTQALQEKKVIADEHFQKIAKYREDFAVVINDVLEKVDQQDTTVEDIEEKKEYLKKKCKNLNILRVLLCKGIVNFASPHTELLSCLRKWRTPRSYAYYQNMLNE